MEELARILCAQLFTSTWSSAEIEASMVDSGFSRANRNRVTPQVCLVAETNITKGQ